MAKRQCLSLQAVQKYEKSIENTVSKQHPTILYRVLTFGKFFHHYNILLTAFINLTDRLGLKPPIYSTEHLIKATNNKTEQYEADLQNWTQSCSPRPQTQAAEKILQLIRKGLKSQVTLCIDISTWPKTLTQLQQEVWKTAQTLCLLWQARRKSRANLSPVTIPCQWVEAEMKAFKSQSYVIDHCSWMQGKDQHPFFQLVISILGITAHKVNSVSLL